MARRPDRRDSRTADRPGPAEASPFRSSRPSKRVLAARAMILKRDREIDELEAKLADATDPALQAKLTTRLVATINNRKSWLTYLADGSPKETRAVVVV